MSEGAPLLERVANTSVGPFTLGEVLPVPPLIALALWDTVLGHSDVVSGPPWAVAALLCAAAVALLWRRRHPLLVVGVIALLGPLQLLLWGPTHSSGGLLCVAIAVFACGAHGRRPAAYLGMAIGAGILTLGTWVDDPDAFADSWAWGLNMVWVFGLGSLVRREKLLGERARGAVDAQAAAESAEERLTLARDLHDVLAHSLAVMIVQAEAADALVDTDPESARLALSRVQETGRSALGDIRGLVGTLRQVEDRVPRNVSSAPGFADVAALVESIRGSGLPVRLHVTGDVAGRPRLTGQVVYRVVQEALTNTLRHAGAVATTVSIDCAGEPVVVRVHDVGSSALASVGATMPGVATSSGGHGLQGMRERVAYVGGTLEAGPEPGGGFTVSAWLPDPGRAR